MSGIPGQPNFDDLDKFLVSLGLAAIVGAGAIPWLLQSGSEDLRLSKADLADLTPKAQDVIERRQAWLGVISIVAPWISVILVAVGVIAIIKGLVGWRTRQARIDVMDDIALETSRTKLMLLTPEQTEEKLEAEVDQAVGDVWSENRPNDRVKIRHRLKTAEQAVIEALIDETPSTHRLLANVRFGGPNSRFAVDALVSAERSIGNDVVVDVKLALTPSGVIRSFNRTAALIAANRGGRPVSVLVVVVHDETWSPEQRRRVISQATAKFGEHGTLARIDFVKEIDLSSYRPRLDDLIRSDAGSERNF